MLPAAEGTHDGVRALSLHADDLDAGIDLLRVEADAGQQASSPCRNDDHVHVGQIAADLIGDGPLPGDHVLIVKGMNEHRVALLLDAQRLFIAFVIVVAGQDDLSAISSGGHHLGDRRALGHHDRRLHAQLCARIAYPLCVIARAARDDRTRAACFLQPRQLVEGAPDLEGTGLLPVFALQEQVASAHGRKRL